MSDPFTLFDDWFAEAQASEPSEPNAMALATAEPNGRPSVRIVLLKAHGPDGFVFYTNQRSRKGEELAHNPNAALLFHWKSLRRQARFRGPVAQVSAAESDAYFASRARGSQIGAWASQQSRPLAARADLEAAVETYERQFGSGDVPRPDYWRGYRLEPVEIEFWRDRPSRLHERVRFTRSEPESAWDKRLLYP